MKRVPITGGKGAGLFILVDDSDFDLVAQHRWNLDPQGYAITHIRMYGSDIRVRIQRYILNPPAGFEVDHRNQNKLDNRRSNLRIASPSQNQANQGLSKANKTGYKGVSLDSRKMNLAKPWIARIKVQGRSLHIGRYGTKEEAAKAYNHAAVKHFGEFAWLNPIDTLLSPDDIKNLE